MGASISNRTATLDGQRLLDSDCLLGLIEEARAQLSLALRRIGGIAAGDADAWTQVKKMSGCRDVLATRVGIHYRLLFRVDATQHTLEILDLVGREALDRTLKRYR